MPAETGDDAVAVALMLDLEHDTLVWLVNAGGGLRHDAVEAGSFEALEPVVGGGAIARGRRQMQRRFCVLQDSLERGSAHLERLAPQVAIAFAKNVEEHHRGGDLLRQCLHPRCCRMQAKLQRLEVEGAVARDYDFAV